MMLKLLLLIVVVCLFICIAVRYRSKLIPLYVGGGKYNIDDQVVVRNYGTFSVGRLIKLSKDIPIVELQTEDIFPILDSKLWEKDNIPMSPMEMLSDADKVNKINSSDMKYPILVFDNLSTGDHLCRKRSDNYDIKIIGRYDILDGLHRVCKAYLDNVGTIKAKIIPWEILLKAEVDEFKFE